MNTESHLDKDMPGQIYESVWDAIEDTPDQSANMRLRSELMIALKAHIKKAGWTQTETARLMGVTQPRVSDLMRGQINLFGIDSLIAMASAVGLIVEVRVSEAA